MNKLSHMLMTFFFLCSPLIAMEGLAELKRRCEQLQTGEGRRGPQGYLTHQICGQLLEDPSFFDEAQGAKEGAVSRLKKIQASFFGSFQLCGPSDEPGETYLQKAKAFFSSYLCPDEAAPEVAKKVIESHTFTPSPKTSSPQKVPTEKELEQEARWIEEQYLDKDALIDRD